MTCPDCGIEHGRCQSCWNGWILLWTVIVVGAIGISVSGFMLLAKATGILEF